MHIVRVRREIERALQLDDRFRVLPRFRVRRPEREMHLRQLVVEVARAER